ncbi:MAG: hypothetical protein HUJ29_04550 [Gammaproteobacteria bacterium]|nr:hypothetical protein [Gammaproteobacteria bacterium]
MMSIRPLDLAHHYMDCFYGTCPLQDMENILAPGLKFDGPLYCFSSSRDYLDSLKRDPPVNSTYQLLKQYECTDGACLVYTFTKPGVETLMTQFFKIKNDRITKIKLLFDEQAFH